MNIFYLDKNPTKCAQYHCDKHVCKMVIEVAQLLCTSHWMSGSEAPYRKTHVNHHSNKWVRESLSNYKWLCELGMELCKEYTYRYGKIHKTQQQKAETEAEPRVKVGTRHKVRKERESGKQKRGRVKNKGKRRGR